MVNKVLLKYIMVNRYTLLHSYFFKLYPVLWEAEELPPVSRGSDRSGDSGVGSRYDGDRLGGERK